ncbi:hypothetical protein K0M31_012708 [Melipona bicolor]|uniref:Uncharacterized protein n=1 Tax=Melipona bicolor TaxID=60889 RepID=A0AA40FJ17_9HYME|nr:hypothetical protein K0M31_012708 [Melipona bicolor]
MRQTRWTRTGERIELKGMAIVSSDSELCPRSSMKEHSQLEERSFVVDSSDLCHNRCATFSLVDLQTRKEPETGLGGSPVIAVHVDSRQRSDKRYVLDKAVLFNQSSYGSPGAFKGEAAGKRKTMVHFEFMQLGRLPVVTASCTTDRHRCWIDSRRVSIKTLLSLSNADS